MIIHVLPEHNFTLQKYYCYTQEGVQPPWQPLVSFYLVILISSAHFHTQMTYIHILIYILATWALRCPGKACPVHNGCLFFIFVHPNRLNIRSILKIQKIPHLKPILSRFSVDFDDHKSTISQSSSTVSLPVCRICQLPSMEPNNHLISPCRCLGSIRYVHNNCLLVSHHILL